MQIGIIGGTGAEGRGLAARLGAAGVQVLLGSRDVARAREAVARVTSGSASIEPATNDTIVDRCDVIFLTIPFTGAAAVVETYGDRFREGTLLIDVTVPLTFVEGVPRMDTPAEGSASEWLRARLPPSVRVAAALKTIPAHVLVKADAPLDCDEFVCGDSPETVAAAMEVVRLIPGLRPIDAGGLDAARALERMTLLLVGINKRYRVRTGRFRVVGV